MALQRQNIRRRHPDASEAEIDRRFEEWLCDRPLDGPGRRKLHADLADRVSQRREGANRLYVSLLVGLTVFSAALLRYGTGDAPARIVLCAVGIVGALLAVSWFVVIRSYRQLNTGKFKTLTELEKKLAYPFFTREWELLTADEWRALREVGDCAATTVCCTLAGVRPRPLRVRESTGLRRGISIVQRANERESTNAGP